jgi:repressor LexA
VLAYEQLFVTGGTMAEVLTPMRRQILEYIVACQRERSFPPTIREIGEHVGLSSSATVANHITVLKNAGYIEKNPQQPRTLTVRLDAANPAPEQHIRHIPFVGDVAAGTGVLGTESANELMSIPEQFSGRGDSFVLQVRGDSMVDAGILSGDYIVGERQQTARDGEIVVAGIPDDEATVKRFFRQGSRIILKPENSSMEPMDFDSNEVVVYGRVISVLRHY